MATAITMSTTGDGFNVCIERDCAQVFLRFPDEESAQIA
jgi:hypothetical protein